MNDDYGHLIMSPETALVRFERELAAAIDVVWDLLTTADGLEQWLAPATVDLQVGGDMDIDFGEDGLAGGTIIELNPPTVLEYRWQFPGETDSILRFELSSTEAGTHMVLEHRLLPLDQSVGYGAGWHAHLDQLAAMATGGNPVDWNARFGALLPEYQAAAAV